MKRLIKKTVLASGALRLASHYQPPGTAILMFHSVLQDPEQYADILGGIAHSENEFRAQMELVARDFQPVGLETLVKCLNDGEPLHKRSVVITFDDGYRDNYEVAMPILNQLGIPATFYITVDCIEKKKLPWPSRLRFAVRNTKLAAWTDSGANTWKLDSPCVREQVFATVCNECCQLAGQAQEDFVMRVEQDFGAILPATFSSLMMDYDQVRGLLRHGHIVGSHTMTHPNMAYVGERDARLEFAGSKEHLERELRSPVQHFAYPCPALSPHWNEQTVELSRELRYCSAVTTDVALTRRGDNPLCLRRMRPTKTAEGLRWNLERAFAAPV